MFPWGLIDLEKEINQAYNRTVTIGLKWPWIGEIDEELKWRGKKLKGHKNLTNITRIGDISATILLNTIGDINDFGGDHKLAAYIGIVPRVHIFNKTTHYGRITKIGNKIARTALVQCALIAVRYNPYLRSFYLKLNRLLKKADVYITFTPLVP